MKRILKDNKALMTTEQIWNVIDPAPEWYDPESAESNILAITSRIIQNTNLSAIDDSIKFKSIERYSFLTNRPNLF